jgi:5'-nucleotidase
VPRALITNDDGIDSPGLWALAAAARAAGLDVVVAAPHLDSSGVGTSVMSVRDGSRTALHPRELPGMADVEAGAVEGHPAYIVHVAGRGWLDPAPDLVLSGINVGANVGQAVLPSGTVGAALTGARHGWRSYPDGADINLLRDRRRQACRHGAGVAPGPGGRRGDCVGEARGFPA